MPGIEPGIRPQNSLSGVSNFPRHEGAWLGLDSATQSEAQKGKRFSSRLVIHPSPMHACYHHGGFPSRTQAASQERAR
ncbi:jg68 [Pararge aegeria aegeria]|uniref:Jg68 protein n=1 Tax=Pararge aegeria aegeria TaxID=348720 RepID=A0A8S4QDJ4_9NEOP|nr:jg68 [Pararge aegeria aegeria]